MINKFKVFSRDLILYTSDFIVIKSLDVNYQY